MGRKGNLDPLAGLVLGEPHEEELPDSPDLQLTPAREDALGRWGESAWAFLTGKDPDTNKPILWTVDERDIQNPIKPFPSHLEYVRYLVWLLENEDKIWGEKSSQMFFS